MIWPVHRGLAEERERWNAHLRPLLLDMADRLPDAVSYAPGMPSFFVNKWRSDNTLHRHPDPVISELVAFIETHANRYDWPGNPAGAPLKVTAMWAIVAWNGMFGRRHRHIGVVSGAYYVDEGDHAAAPSGAFVAIEEEPYKERLIRPRSGAIMMFRSDMWHAVARYDGTRPRIVISFNLTVAGTG
jgi:hypothetical protein